MADDYELKSGAQHATQTELGQNPSRLEMDNMELTRLGKKPVLKRSFSFITMLSFSCTIMITWEGVLLLLPINLNNGGPAGSVYGLIIVWAGTMSVFATMGELASMAPTAGGQYHWVSMLAPKSSQKFLSYSIGWLTMIGWQAIVASGGYLCGSLVQGLMVLNNPNYVPQPWQLVLLFWAAILFAIFFNTAVSAVLPKIEGFILIMHTLGFLAILIPLVYYGPHASATDVFTSFLNEGNWQTQGLSFVIGIIGPVFSFLGADCAVHMSEEIKNPAKNVPRAMVFSIFLNGLMGFGTLIAVLFCLGDLNTIQSVLTTSTGYPFMAIFQDSVGSLGGALTMAALITILNITATIGFVTTASRMTWSFARDRGVPGWKILSKIESRSTLPLATIALTAIIAILLSLVVFGSTVAFNDLVSLSINGLYTSYLIGNGLLLYRRLSGDIQQYSSTDETLKNTIGAGRLTWGPWRIPEPLGTINNILGCIYMVVVLIFSFWPTAINPTPETMNYSSLMVGATILFSVLYYMVWARKVYVGPVIEICLSG
ncbi:hypothetical protein MMC17_006408 [Xylographa soralifera]|nr:hypothetical protein [Xylographa soralifera]